MMPAPLSSIGHRPWPLPSSDWTVRQDWIDLAFLHWKLSPSLLEPLLPDGLILDTFNDEAWIGIVPFRMDRVNLNNAMSGRPHGPYTVKKRNIVTGKLNK